MRAAIVLAAALLAGAAAAQQPPAGIPPEWETQKMLQQLAEQTKRLQPIVQRMNPQEWVAQGAPDAYIAQWKSTLAEIDYIVRSAGALAQQPERLSLALDTYFRMQAVESRLMSLVDAVRRYQNPAAADVLQSSIAENSGSRDKLRQYLFNLAAVKEQEFKVVNEEAQRCRGTLMRSPQSKTPAGKR